MTEEAEVAYLSPSKIQALMKCPEQFYFDYVAKIPKLSSGTFHFGLVTHAVIERALKQVILGGKLPSWKDASDWATSDWVERWAKEESKPSFMGWSWNKGDALEKAKADLNPLVKFTLEEILPKIRPVYAEHRWNREYDALGGGTFKVYGVIDVVEEGGSVIDWKTANGEVSKFAKNHDAQVDAYGVQMADEFKRDVVPFRKIFLVRGPRPRAETSTYNVGPRHRERFRNVAQKAWAMIQAKAYVANNGGWWCSEGWCSHWGICAFGGALLREEF